MPYCQNCETPVTDDICPLCGQRALPMQDESKAQQPATRRKSITIVTAASIIVAIILFISIIVLLLNRPEPPEEAPGACLYFYEDPDIVARHYGNIAVSRPVEHDKIEIFILDASVGTTSIMMLDRENFIQTQDGLNMTYNDVNDDDKFDRNDSILIDGGGTGDRITIIFRPTDESIANAALP